MIFPSKTITLKNGKSAILRTASPENAAEMLSYIQTASGETDFLSRYPEEWTLTVEQEAGWLNALASSPYTLAITCFVDGKVAGNCEISFKRGIKEGHRASVAIAILKAYWGLGIGSAMFEELISAAKEHGTEIIELEYIQGNDRAKRLYEKYGFKTVAEKPGVIKLKDGTYLSEFYMQKHL
jgi:RimJ/RimL family protein N-acetyltransferase